MSTAHRPNWTAAKGRESKAHLSRQTTVYDIPQHTKLKFRQPASTSAAAGSSGRRDLKRELEEAEWEAKNRKRIKGGLEALPFPSHAVEGEEERRRRERIQQAIELDRDSDASSSSDDEEDDEDDAAKPTSSKSPSHANANDDSSTSSSSSDSDSEEDEQALLLAELTKIRAERQAEQSRLSQLASTTSQLSREEEIARGNPLLNLQSALRPREEADFAVQKRWDHDVIFKNQASAAGNGGKGGFVNDLTRSEFHKKFMNRYIK